MSTRIITTRLQGFILATLAFTGLTSGTVQSAELTEERVWSGREQDCLLEQLKTAGSDLTVGQLRAQCKSAPDNRTAGEAMREYREQGSSRERFLVEPHHANYILPIGLQHGAEPGFDNENPRKEEAKYQISFKSKVEDDLLGRDLDLYFAYTQTSFWQIYDNDDSKPFRENDYSPELFVEMPLNWEWRDAHFISWRMGVLHQSNGRGPDYSRSWNRVYADFLFEHGNAWMSIKPWWRIPEDAGDDDNPDITTYLGHAELWGGYRWNDHRLTVMTRNYWESNGKGAVQLDYSYPLTRYFRWNVQLFNGQGESLLDYDETVSRISVGVMLEDGIH